MGLILEGADVETLVKRLAERQKLSESEAVVRALRRDWARLQSETEFVEGAMEIVRELKAKSDPARRLPVDKAFIDGLYE